MNRFESRLKRILHDALFLAEMKSRPFQDDFDALFTSAIDDNDSALDIAAKALFHLCVDDGRFNKRTVLLKAVRRFLSEHAEAPAKRDELECLSALGEVFRSDCCTYEDIRTWVGEWFR